MPPLDMPGRIVAAAIMIATLPASFTATSAWAENPSDVVGFFYAPALFVAAPEFRDMFVDPARSIFDRNDIALRNGEEIGCIDFSPAIDAQDFDQDELTRSLRLLRTVRGEEAEIVASLRLFPNDETRREVIWSLRSVQGDWKISDIVSGSGEWRIEDFDCLPAKSVVP